MTRRDLERWERRSRFDHHWGSSGKHVPTQWKRHRRLHRGALFLRFVTMFGLMALLMVGGMAALARLLTRLFGGGTEVTILTWVAGCGLSLTLPLMAGFLALRVFHGVATPLADVMDAADALAAGDLGARVPVPEHGPDEFANLAASFNRMAQELERANQQRRNLTADVAHELRNPLHIIQGNLEGVLDGVYEPTHDHVLTTLEEARHLARLVEDLRTLSLADAGELQLRREAVDVAELLADVRTSLSGQVEAAELELRVSVASDVPTISGDVGRLAQVLNNLLANALRHTAPGGSIALEAWSADDSVRIVVTDTGEGIPTEDLPYIFDRFWRGDRARSRGDRASTGLGLAIARHLVEAHGGRITVESRLGEGTTFFVDLPREPTS